MYTYSVLRLHDITFCSSVLFYVSRIRMYENCEQRHHNYTLSIYILCAFVVQCEMKMKWFSVYMKYVSLCI